MTPGRRFRRALDSEYPLQIAGVLNAFTALLAARTGFRALYLSGAGVANMAYGLPDLGLTTLTETLEEVRRICSVTAVPLMVDADTGWGGRLNLTRGVRLLCSAGAAGMHLEDQVVAKRCGHRPGKTLVDDQEMVGRIKAAVDARTDQSFVVMARTDAVAVEGLGRALERANRYQEAGADCIFAEALLDLEQFRQFSRNVTVPVLANMTEFGVTPLYTAHELSSVGVRMVLYPLSAFRVMASAADRIYRAIRIEGSQKSHLAGMQNREELYRIIGYHAYEQQLDQPHEDEMTYGNRE